MNSHPLITIVLPVYNRQEVVKRTLKSIAEQSYRPLNVVLVDNNSADDTLSVLKQWAEVNNGNGLNIEVISCERPGASAARNEGLKRVTTPWVLFFDSDDTMKPNHLQRIVAAIESDDTYDVVGWDVYSHSINGKERRLPFLNRHLLYDCVLHGTFATQRYVCRTDLIRDCGAWDETIKTWDDIELGTRLLNRYPDINVHKLKGSPTVDVYESTDSITGQTYHSRARESEHALDLMSRTIQPYLQYIVNLKRVILAANYRKEGYKDDAVWLRNHALRSTEKLWHRLLLRGAYTYTAIGGRGVARMLYPLF